MAGALAFVHPSPNESLSIVALEAMAQGTPVIVNGDCAALEEHVLRSGTGHAFRGPEQLHGAIDAVRALDAGARAEQGRRARDYVLAGYGREAVRARLVAEIDALARG
jgi:glycosyltransferase involved in cell wall biosynthesis